MTKKTYRVVYTFRYELDVDAESAESAAAIAQQVDWEDWTETFSGPYVEFEMDNFLSQILFDMGAKEKES